MVQGGFSDWRMWREVIEGEGGGGGRFLVFRLVEAEAEGAVVVATGRLLARGG